MRTLPRAGGAGDNPTSNHAERNGRHDPTDIQLATTVTGAVLEGHESEARRPL